MRIDNMFNPLNEDKPNFSLFTAVNLDQDRVFTNANNINAILKQFNGKI